MLIMATYCAVQLSRRQTLSSEDHSAHWPPINICSSCIHAVPCATVICSFYPACTMMMSLHFIPGGTCVFAGSFSKSLAQGRKCKKWVRKLRWMEAKSLYKLLSGSQSVSMSTSDRKVILTTSCKYRNALIDFSTCSEFQTGINSDRRRHHDTKNTKYEFLPSGY